MQIILSKDLELSSIPELKDIPRKSWKQEESNVVAEVDVLVDWALENGRIDLLHWMDNHLRQDKSLHNIILEKVVDEDGSALARLISNSKLDDINWLAGLLKGMNPSSLENIQYLFGVQMLETINKGDLECVNKMLAFANQIHDIAFDFAAYLQLYKESFVSAAQSGNIAMLETLKEGWFQQETPYFEFEELLRNIFVAAAFKGQLPVLNWASEFVTTNEARRIMYRAQDYYIHCSTAAADAGQAEVLAWIYAKCPDKLEEIIGVTEFGEQYFPIHLSLRSGHLNILAWLKSVGPEYYEPALNGCKDVFMEAASTENKLLLDFIEEQAPGKLGEWISEYEYSVERYINQSTVPLVISFPKCFAVIEMHQHEYGTIVNQFIEQKIADLRSRRDLIESDTHQVFDIEPNEAELCFYIIRNIIRRNDPGLFDNLRFLIEIPAVKQLMHRAVTSFERPNELLRFALGIGNQGAAEILLSIPAVRAEMALRNNYAGEVSALINLEELARDRESSMRALTTAEQNRLEKLTEHYGPTLKEVGGAELISQLRTTLIRRYEASPAKIVRDDGSELQLPMNKAGFDRLALSKAEKQRALEAYYTHKDHTAFRYLSKPNPWMNATASYVNVNPERVSERWSTFEEYQPLIALLYLAAVDEKIEATEGFNVETRFEHFIDELAHIGRAHNWDDTRVTLDSSGKPQVDDDGNEMREEYDDLTGDKPSCYSGVKRRLFQSVLGHPLLQVLTPEIVEQELASFIRSSFQEKINESNRDSLYEEYEQVMLLLEKTEMPLLQALDITLDQQQAFIRTMQEKYGPQFDAEFETQVKNKFRLKTHGVEYACHAQKFAGSAHLDKLLAQPKKAQPSISSAHSLFSPSSLLLTTEELKEVAQMIKRLEETPMLPEERIESRENIIGALQYLVDKSAQHQSVSETIGHITTTCPALYDELYKDTAVLLDRLAKNHLDVPQEPKP